MRAISRHKSIDVLSSYVRDADAFTDHAGNGLLCRGEDFCGEHAENIDRAALGSDVAPAENSSRLRNHVERMLI
jgi:hypothetical protein